jgi:hypothetical protein
MTMNPATPLLPRVRDPPILGAFEKKTEARPLMLAFERTGDPPATFDAWFEKGDRSNHVVMFVPVRAKLLLDVASNHREHPGKFRGEKPDTGCECFPVLDIVLLEEENCIRRGARDRKGLGVRRGNHEWARQREGVGQRDGEIG